MALRIERAGAIDAVTGGPSLEGPVVITERLFWDETKTRLLPEGDPEARFLAHAEGSVIPAATARLAGIPVPGDEPVAKMADRPRDKARRRTVNKADHQLAPGVVADTSLDGEAHVLIAEPGTPLRNGEDR